MANCGSDFQNGSQFFMTVGECQWLNNKHTVFGKIDGNFIFNLLNISEVETNEDSPVCEKIPKIMSALVIENPFDDIIPRNIQIENKKTEIDKI